MASLKADRGGTTLVRFSKVSSFIAHWYAPRSARAILRLAMLSFQTMRGVLCSTTVSQHTEKVTDLRVLSDG